MTEVSTPPPMLPLTGEVTTPPVRRSRVGYWLVGGIVSVVGLLGLSMVVPAQWLGRVVPGHALIDDGAVANKPGSAQPTARRVAIDGFDVFDSDGEILFTTVSVDSRVSVFDWLRSEIDGDIDLKGREEVFGDLSREENRERNLQLMATSKDSAIVAAFGHLGVEVVDESGIAFESIVEGGPVDGLMVVGDVIIGVDGVTITSFESLRAELDVKVPGTQGVLTVENVDTLEVRDVELTWGAHPDGFEGGFIGIGNVVVRAEDLPLPFDVDIDSGSIGGPSAGLAFTLTLIDLMTEGELTGGRRVAVTGTISPGGRVGSVGGVAQKAAAAHGAGAAGFIVPASLVEEARAHARDMPVFGAETLDDALAALAELGGETEDLQLILR